jgi:hypothetical protein
MKLFFEKPVDKRSRRAMVDFLLQHLRYDGGYAHCVKVYQLDLPRDIATDAAFRVLERGNYWNDLQWPIEEFQENWNHCYAICTAGRSSGYLTLSHASLVATNWKSYCRTCGQREFQAARHVTPPPRSAASCAVLLHAGLSLPTLVLGNRCAACGAIGEGGRVNFAMPPKELRLGASVDDTASEIAEMAMDDLRERVNLLTDFARCCDEIRSAFIDLARSLDVADTEEADESELRAP